MSQIGHGIFTRDPTINPPKVRKILSQIGNEPITSLQLVRTPLSSATSFLLNIASFFQLQNKLKQANIDKLFHLALIINGKYVLEKNDVIDLSTKIPDISKSETLVIPIPDGKNITINQLIENTQKQMGRDYGPYDAKTNNCGVFISNVLSSNGLQSPTSDSFINQKTEELFNKFPSLTEKIAKFATNTGAVANRLIQGEGQLETYNFQLRPMIISV